MERTFRGCTWPRAVVCFSTSIRIASPSRRVRPPTSRPPIALSILSLTDTMIEDASLVGRSRGGAGTPPGRRPSSSPATGSRHSKDVLSRPTHVTARQRIFSPVVFASLQRLLRSRAYRLAILPYMAPSLPAATSGAGLVGEAATSWVGLALSFLLGASVAALTAAAMVHRRRAARRGRGGRRVTASGEAARRFLAAIVESSEDAIIGKTLEGTITSWNRGAERMFGYTAEEVIGRPISIIVPPEVDNDLPTILERLRRGERVEHYQTVRMRSDELGSPSRSASRPSTTATAASSRRRRSRETSPRRWSVSANSSRPTSTSRS